MKWFVVLSAVLFTQQIYSNSSAIDSMRIVNKILEKVESFGVIDICNNYQRNILMAQWKAIVPKAIALGVSPEALKATIESWHNNYDKITKKNIITIADFSKRSNEKRFFYLDLDAQIVEGVLVAHGVNSSSPCDLGLARIFSNEHGSYQSSIGAYVTDDNTYYGKYEKSLRIHGLNKRYNSNAYARNIVLHQAPYVADNTKAAKEKADTEGWGGGETFKNYLNSIRDDNELERIGNSQGCFATENNHQLDKLKGGSFIYAHPPLPSYYCNKAPLSCTEFTGYVGRKPPVCIEI